MTEGRSVSWDDSKKKRRMAALLVAALLVFLPMPRQSSAAHTTAQPRSAVIVESLPGALDDTRHAIRDLGGTIQRDLGIIGGFVASVPSEALQSLRTTPSVRSVTLDGSVQLHSTFDDSRDGNPGARGTQGESEDAPKHDDAANDKGSMWRIARTVGARSVWAEGITGDGVDVALIDSGVVPVDGLTAPGKIVNGPDLSFESQNDGLRYLDTFGHGTHVAGIIAGVDNSVATNGDRKSADNFAGIAPGARIVNVKVADAAGATDVSQVIAGIDWVVQHRHDNGLNIRVLNLSFGTDGQQDYVVDPLAHAVEVAWDAGIVVVAAAGNRGDGTTGLDNPARDPHIIAVGADDPNGTASARDDSIPSWSSSGDGVRNPDVVAPGKSVVSLRDPGSYIDQRYPRGRVDTRFFRGSGTSAAAAVVSGGAALLLQQNPQLTPDQVKALLTLTAHPLPDASPARQGAGLINLRDASAADSAGLRGDGGAAAPVSSGAGSIEGARGSSHVERDGSVLSGEQDIFGAAWTGARWGPESTAHSSWTGGTWNGNVWTGDGWSGESWAGAAWASATWAADSWVGSPWSGKSWSGNSWSGNSWSGNSWSGNSWSGNSWSFMEDGQ
jgi:serine protease AprX